ncbi:hypothetical protein [Gryllotalpicola koreensis]|uniref:Uncharacterized protein n=1 Tax=Gryllotalpicola koreensis TaxID=993086 RepID=A0ABP7ZQK1_9MICO
MSVLGVVVVPGGKNPRVHGVVLEGTVADPRVVDTFELRTGATEPSEQAVDLARHLSPKLDRAGYERAGIRVAGTTPVPRRSKAAFSRAHCEGAILFVLREVLREPVVIVEPVAAARVIGLTKAELETLVDRLASQGVNGDAVLAGLAALASL